MNQKPAAVANIRESECIGCMKCINACPQDAIIGSGKLMHTVLLDECTGCELCVEPCPVDCIDILPLQDPNAHEHKQAHFKKRLEARVERLELSHLASLSKKQKRTEEEKKQYIHSALLRVKQKKSTPHA